MKTPLIIIDMQRDFRDDDTIPVIPGVVHQIEQAKKRQDSIFIVEFRGCGATMPEVKKPLRLYRRKKTVYKNTVSGARDLAPHLKKFSKVRVCGVYGDACVYETIKKLIDIRPDLMVEVAVDAVDDSWDLKQLEPLYRRNKQVTLFQDIWSDKYQIE